MKTTHLNSAALFMALALTAAPFAPALAGTSHGGSPLASTDEHASVKAGEGATEKTVEKPIAAQVNIQPSVRAGDTVKANADANAKLMGTNHSDDMKSDTSTAAKTVIDPDAPPKAK